MDLHKTFIMLETGKWASLFRTIKMTFWIAAVIVGLLIIFSPGTLGLPPAWRRLMVFVLYVDMLVIVHYVVNRSIYVVKNLFFRNVFSRDHVEMSCELQKLGGRVLCTVLISAVAYLPLWPIDKLLDMKRESDEKKQRIEDFVCGERKMSDDMKTSEEAYGSSTRCPWAFETKSIEVRNGDDVLVFGNNRFVVALANEGRANHLYSLHSKASIAELSSFATYLYDAAISPRIKNHSSMPREATAIVEFCYQVQIAYIESMSDLVCDAFFKGERDELRDELGGQFPYKCRSEFSWDEATEKVLGVLSFRLQGRDIGKAAIKYGGFFAECNPKYIVARLKDIERNAAIDIRENSYKDSEFPLDKCEDFAATWRELHVVAYYEAAQQLMRMNKEISDALTYVQDTSGYDNLHRMVELWRPLASKSLKRHCYLFCDLPVVVGAHVAFAEVASAEGFFKNDRTRASKSAFQISRMLYEGKVTSRLQSNYAANQLVQYHGALKRVMGKDQYTSLMTSLKLPAPEVLKVQEVK